jgi:hypothetical protein
MRYFPGKFHRAALRGRAASRKRPALGVYSVSRSTYRRSAQRKSAWGAGDAYFYQWHWFALAVHREGRIAPPYAPRRRINDQRCRAPTDVKLSVKYHPLASIIGFTEALRSKRR